MRGPGRAPDGSGGRGARRTDSRPNSVGLKLPALSALIDDLEAGEGDGRKRRRFVRWPFRRESVELSVTHPGGNVVTMKVACRNLSAAGVSLLHSSFLHPGSACEVTLPGVAGPVRAKGVIARCQHRSGVVHEIGVRFDRPVSMREFLARDVFSDWYTREHVDPGTLEGTAACLVSSALDQRVLRHFLRESSVKLRPVETVREAVEAAIGGASLILCDDAPGGRDVAELVASLRAATDGVPLLLITGEEPRAARARLGPLELDAVLPRPLSQDVLLRALAEFLIDTRGPRPAGRAAVDLRAAWQAIGEIAGQLRAGLRKQDPEPLFGVCFNLRAVAERAGLRPVERAAEAALRALAEPGAAMPTAELEALLRACERPGGHGDAPTKPGGGGCGG